MRIRAVLILFLAVFACVAGHEAAAQPVPPTCDPAVKGVIDARAWMGGKRDMETAQTTIRKRQEDSILDISCFDRHINDFAQRNNVLFSDGHTRFSGSTGPARLFRNPPYCYGPGCPCTSLIDCSFPFNPPWPTDSHQPTFFPVIPGPNPPGGPYTNMSLDNSFIRLIRTALRRHWNPNFYLAGPPAPPATVCTSMSNMWHITKCVDIDKNGWITFQDSICNDRRGPDCSTGCRAVWQNNFDSANPPAVPRFPAAPPVPPGGLDQTLPYRTTIYPAACGSVAPVRTGLIVDVSGTAHQDAVCPGVNCWYNYSAGTCN